MLDYNEYKILKYEVSSYLIVFFLVDVLNLELFCWIEVGWDGVLLYYGICVCFSRYIIRVKFCLYKFKGIKDFLKI